MNCPPNFPLSTWTYYFNVPKLEAAVEKVEQNGGEVLFGPCEIPGGDFFIVANDPQRAHFGLLGPLS